VGLRSREADASVAAPVQPKRLALLVYLALAPRRRFRRRDQIVALLWPDSDTAHARQALNQAVRYLRRSLTEGAIMSQGEEELALDGTLVRCDAGEFKAKADAGECERALAIYQGAFLDGFFVEDAAPEWQSWVDGERSSFRLMAADAAAACVATAERRGDIPAALRWARRGVAISPDDEPSIARLIRLLDASGDRVGALSTYETLRQRLMTEFRATPSTETEAIASAVRGR
jgi:DNA-binding SARP family transcriptional activator